MLTHISFGEKDAHRTWLQDCLCMYQSLLQIDRQSLKKPKKLFTTKQSPERAADAFLSSCPAPTSVLAKWPRTSDLVCTFSSNFIQFEVL
jgi:hypothetical protein